MAVAMSVRSCVPLSAAWVRKTHAGFTQLVGVWRARLCRTFEPYRPEIYYMRGPGPKWREKHRNAPLRQIDACRPSDE